MNQENKKRFKFLDWLRCIGVCLIVYDHLGPLRNSEWWLSRMIENLVNIPLGIIQYFGAFGVCLFFIISGFCLTASASTRWKFIYKKIIRIVGTLLVATALFYCFNKAVSLLVGQTYWDQFTLHDWIGDSLLACYLFGRDSVINGATWYLFPLMGVYFIVALFYRLLNKNPAYLAGILDAIFIGLWMLGRFKGIRIIQMQWLIFMLVPVFGILIHSIYDKRISASIFLVAFITNYIVFLKCIVIFREDYYFTQPYMISLAYAVLIFAIGLLLEDKLILPRVIKFVSDISFSIYLLHMPLGGLIMTGLGKYCGFTVCFVIAVTIVGMLAWGYHELIEKRVIGKL